MALDFQQVYEQIRQLGEQAPQREQRLKELRQQACELLERHAEDLDALRNQVALIVHSHDPSLRCALPVFEPLSAHLALPELPRNLTILAADGSQIAPDRHAPVEYCLINVGAVQIRHGAAEPAVTKVTSRLFYAEEIETPSGLITEATLALRRDLNERSMLADLAVHAQPPVVTFTDGPMELWGGQDREGEETSEFQKSLDEYKRALARLNDLQVITAGYVDKPSANLVVRLLETMMIPEDRLSEIRRLRLLQGVSDRDLYRAMLGAGERSAVFALQSQSAKSYSGPLALHFFYINVGRPGHPWLARVDIPAWVAESSHMVDTLQATLVQQCRTMGSRSYPYLLHRAHETAVVTLQEREQITQMIVMELRKRGVPVGEPSQKQSAKDLPGRTRYER
jgi:hypothetical protein